MRVTGTDSRVTSLTLMMTRKIRSRGAGQVCHKPVKTSQDTLTRMTDIICADITRAERYNNYDGNQLRVSVSRTRTGRGNSMAWACCRCSLLVTIPLVSCFPWPVTGPQDTIKHWARGNQNCQPRLQPQQQQLGYCVSEIFYIVTHSVLAFFSLRLWSGLSIGVSLIK